MDGNANEEIARCRPTLGAYTHETDTLPFQRLLHGAALDLTRPKLGQPVSDMQEAVDAAADAAAIEWRKQLDAAMPQLARDVEGLWATIRDQKEPLADLQALSGAEFRVFANASLWCYSKEGTRNKGRFAIESVGRVTGRTLAELRAALMPVTVNTTCGACGAEATATSQSRVVSSTRYPTDVVCQACGHSDRVGRESTIDHSPNRYQPRLACPCAWCSGLRNSIAKKVAAEIEGAVARAIENLARVAREVGSKLERDPLGETPPLEHPYVGEEVLYDVTRLLRSGTPLQAAVRTATAGPGYYGEEWEVWHALAKRGIASLAVAADSIHRAAWPELLEAAHTALDDEKTLESIIAEAKSGDCARIVAAYEQVRYIWHIRLPVDIAVFVGSAAAAIGTVDEDQTPYASAEVDPDTAGVAAARALLEPHVHSEPASMASRDEPSATELLVMARDLVDRIIGPGAASRSPDLVAEVMRRWRSRRQ